MKTNIWTSTIGSRSLRGNIFQQVRYHTHRQRRRPDCRLTTRVRYNRLAAANTSCDGTEPEALAVKCWCEAVGTDN